MKKFLKKNWKKLLFTFLSLFLIFGTFYLIFAVTLYKGIENMIRIIACFTLIDALILFIVLLTKFRRKIVVKGFVICSIFVFIYTLTITFAGYKINNIYNKISSISSNNYDYYSTSIITRSDNEASSIKDIDDEKIAMIKDEDDYEGYELANLIIDENNLDRKNIVKYDNYVDLLNDLIDGKINFALVPTNYDSRFASNDGLEDIKDKTKIIFTKKEKKEKELTEKKKAKSLDEPFTVLVMGVDTVNDGFSSGFNGDALILVTFNPKTTNATILSIPRDTYMPISCMGDRKNKITNAGWHGEKCIINSLENFFGIDIDYHVKINFNGVVKLVNAVGGVEVDVPYAFCEQNSKRQWGRNTIKVESGKQVLNGEQALAFARHRKVTQYMVNYCGSKYVQHANYWNDFVRGQNQQIIINALLNKIKNIDSFSKIESILDTISNNMETDISTDNILSLYSLAKDILKKAASQEEAFSMQKLYLSGHDAMIYDYSFKNNAGTKLVLYNYAIYKESKEAVIKAMKQNLGLTAITPVKKFSFSIKNTYEPYVIGKNAGVTSDLELMPSFIGSDESVAKTYANSHGINLKINYVTGKSWQRVGQILSQSVPEKTDLDMLDTSHSLTITVVKELPTTVVDTPNDSSSTDNNATDETTDDENEDSQSDDSSSTDENTDTSNN